MFPLRLARIAMRVRFEIALWGEDLVHVRAAGEEALDEVSRVDAELSPYEPTSDLYAINALAADGPVRVLPTTLAFLERARSLSEATGGAFDPTVGPLLEAWGIWSSEGRVPTEEALADALSRSGMARVVRCDPDAGSVQLMVPGARLHPGAIGKGWALDRAAALLRDQGIERALLHGGTSSALAIGGPFPIEIAGIGEASLEDAALGVSGVHGKTLATERGAVGHVIDPRSGKPVAGTRLAAVIARTATAADALSTALLVLGRGVAFSHPELYEHWIEPIS